MAMDALHLALFFHPAYSTSEALSRAKSIIKVLNPNKGPKLAVRETFYHLLKAERDAAFEEGKTRIVLDDWSDDHDETRRVSVDHFEDHGWSVMSVMISVLPYDRAGTTTAWAYALEVAPKIVTVAGPLFAVLGGIGDWPDTKGLKSNKVPQLAPWTWLSKDLLDATTKKALQTMEGLHQVELHKGGLTIQVVPDLYTKPTKAVIQNLASLGIKYKQPTPPKS